MAEAGPATGATSSSKLTAPIMEQYLGGTPDALFDSEAGGDPRYPFRLWSGYYLLGTRQLTSNKMVASWHDTLPQDIKSIHALFRITIQLTIMKD